MARKNLPRGAVHDSHRALHRVNRVRRRHALARLLPLQLLLGGRLRRVDQLCEHLPQGAGVDGLVLSRASKVLHK